MGDIRAPAVAGSFYPNDADELRAELRRHLALARPGLALLPKAVIAPHAGYVYSGPVAGSAFASLASLRGRVTRLVLMGPAHRVLLSAVAVPEADAFATPLGVMQVDRAATAALLSLPQVLASDRAHAGEHSLEVELPFVQEVLGDVPIVPMVVGNVTDIQAAEVLERAWGGPETCVVVSSDLSHYLPYAAARRLDHETALAIEHLLPAEIDEEKACGSIAIRALLRVAKAKGLRASTLDLRNSGDTAGPRDEVVGYGAFHFV
jgi:AmmeMemoRadiSam system protein B